MLYPNPYNVVIIPIDDSDKTKSGLLYIPEQARERCDQGTIKYKGSRVPDYLNINDYVLFSGYSGTLIFLEDEGRLIHMDYRDIICKIGSPATEMNGLYFRDSSGKYWPATYEIVCDTVARNIDNTGIQYGTKNYRKNDDDNKMKGKQLSYFDLPKNGHIDEKLEEE